MDIILLKNIEKVGKKFEVVKVKDGYGRNYLLPQGLAIVANAANRSNLHSFKRREASKQNKMFDHYKALAGQMEGKTLRIEAKAGTSGKIFGSVTSAHVVYALSTQLGIELDKRLVELPEHIKMLGEYTVGFDLHPDVDAKINVAVVAEGTPVAAAATPAAAPVAAAAEEEEEEEEE